MADTTDSKSVARKGVRVQVPPRVLTDLHRCEHRTACAGSRGPAFAALTTWTFVLGPGFVVGNGNGIRG